MQKIVTSFRVFITHAILLGLIYPFFIIGVSHIIFPYQADGSLLECHGEIIGSALIAQEFASNKYFHSRFSSINYNAASSGGSSLAPSSKKLIELTKEQIKKAKLENELSANIQLPADMVLDSASGLDPHISWTNAMLQLPRVAKYRGLSEDRVKNIIHANISPDFIGVWGKEVVNVLKLNLALDKLEATH